MGRKKPVNVGHLRFEKQGDAMGYFQEILWRYNVGDKVIGADEVDLRALLDMHIHVVEKIGVGISQFEIMTSDEGSRCFGVTRLDHSTATFSYKRCINQIWDH